MRVPAILAISLAAVLAGSLLLAGPFSVVNIIPKQDDQSRQAEATILPLMIRDRFTETQMAGDAVRGSNFVVNEDFVNPENHCEFCTRVEYTPGPEGLAGFSYEDAAGLDLSNAKKARFWVMGEEGNEKIKFKFAGKSLDKVQDKLGKLSGKLTKSIFKTERFALTTQEVKLDKDWKKYEVDLSGVDLKGITHPFAFELAGNGGQKQIVYIKGVVYDDELAENPLAATAEEVIDPLIASIISNSTEGVAPATFKFEANVTGGTEPYSIVWNFEDSEDGGPDVTHTFEEAGEYNVTLTAADAGDQNASDSVTILVAELEELEIMEEEVDNSTEDAEPSPQETNSTETQSETSPTGDEGSQAAPQPVNLEADAGIDIVARPSDTLVLEGGITGVDVAAEGLDFFWIRTSGPSIEIDNAESLNPTITIPDLEDDAEIQLQLAARAGSTEDSDSVTVFVQHVDEVEGANEELLDPLESGITEWEDECGDLADCMKDNSDNTFAAASPDDVGNVNLFSFEEFDVENAEIEYVTAVATARTEKVGYLFFVGANAEDEEDQSESRGAVPVFSDVAREYQYAWAENPISNSRWTGESLRSFLAGYAYGDGDSDIEVTEFHLIVTYTVQEPAAEDAEPAQEAEQPPGQSGDETNTNSTGQ